MSLEPQRISFVAVPSLEYMVLVQISTNLWNQEDVRSVTGNYNLEVGFPESKVIWHEAEDMVMTKMQQFHVSESLKKKLSDFIKPVGIELLKWCWYHQNMECKEILKNTGDILWTQLGTINKRKTAELLVADDSLCAVVRARIAGFFCLEDQFSTLNEIVQKQGTQLFDVGAISPNLTVVQSRLVSFWCTEYSIPKEKLCQYKNPFNTLFRCAVYFGNIEATKYFFERLYEEEKHYYIERCASYLVCDGSEKHMFGYTDIVVFLLSKMNAEQEREFLCHNIFNVFRIFLNWPWQQFVIDLANRMWDPLEEYSTTISLYPFLLENIVDKFKVSFGVYAQLFRDFWEQSPDFLRRHTLNSHDIVTLLSNLLEVEDKSSILIILRDATISEKEKIVFDSCGNDIFKTLANSNPNLLKFFICQCLSSYEQIVRLKEHLKERITSSSNYKQEKDIWNIFIELLDNLSQNYCIGNDSENKKPTRKRKKR